MSRNLVTPSTDYISYGYALMVLAGGVAGYMKAGSTASLAAGVLFGSIAAYGAYQTTLNPRNLQVGLTVSGALLALMGYRFYNSGKFMPAGLVAGLSLLQVARLGIQYKR
jgi:uncharacterized membrane protein (UPF0136 family)